MRTDDTHFKHPSFIRRHEYTVFTNMPRSLARIFQRIWFINSEEYVAKGLDREYDSINEYMDWPDTDVADETDVAVLNAFAAQIDSNAQEFMSPHQVACLTALLLASCQDAPDRVSTLETARNELLLWQQECEPAAKIRKGIREAGFHARTASEIARKAADKNYKDEYVEVLNRVAAVARKAADSTEKFRPFIEEDSGDAESRREAAQEVAEAVNLSEEAVKTARELFEISGVARWKAILAKQRFIVAERNFLRIHEA
ncbi:hypothetical protein HMPREF2527_00035 [Rothia sp. HMSC071B01]|uniref:hypothetical protein n=1 Tax=Rothia sp. HMSC071B01 TaxID=1715007 RepID=UPI0008A56BF8|nr:hypothetical protein [Rothia sp. HMSC071B01]OFN75768.1 hypothetical protein HMPREF2527_00035 [Rothia sp. HMSC071B01]